MKENLLKKRKKKGFTLIELIVVIAIIAIIALIAIPKVMGYQDDAKKKADIANAKAIANVVSVEITNGKIIPGSGISDIVIDNTYATAPETASDAPNAKLIVGKNIQSAPKVQSGSHARGYFYVDIDGNSNVTVYDSPSGTSDRSKLYPSN